MRGPLLGTRVGRPVGHLGGAGGRARAGGRWRRVRGPSGWVVPPWSWRAAPVVNMPPAMHTTARPAMPIQASGDLCLCILRDRSVPVRSATSGSEGAVPDRGGVTRTERARARETARKVYTARYRLRSSEKRYM